ncbi:MAG: amino acid adenylation domain-containing protein [Acidobacteriota bacterium]|nr:amino acid adenylation domain-containing protein [Acidobacteriota bacterium]
MAKRQPEAVYPLSPRQAFILSECRNRGMTRFNGQLYCHVHGALDIGVLEKSWQETVRNTSMLRSFFVWERLENPVQVVQKDVDAHFEFLDWSGETADWQQKTLEQRNRQCLQEELNLTRPSLVRLNLCKTGEQDYICRVDYHAIVLDEDSLAIVLDDLFNHYQAGLGGLETGMSKKAPFLDYINWVKKQNLNTAAAYWQEVLAGFEAGTPMFPSPVDQTTVSRDRATLDLPFFSDLRQFAAKHGLNWETFVKGAWAIVASRYTNDHQVVIGHVLSGRKQHSGFASMTGPLSNTLPSMVSIAPSASILQWLRDLDAQLLRQESFEPHSLEQIREWVDEPVFQRFFDSSVVCGEAAFTTRRYGDILLDSLTTVFPCIEAVHLQAVSRDQQLELVLQYETGIIDSGAAQRVLKQVATVLEGLITQSQGKLVNLPLLPEDESHSLRVEWNSGPIDYPIDQTINKLFDAQVARTPNVIAVEHEGRTLTFAQLDKQANQLAHHLQELGVGIEVKVALCIERSIEMIVAIVGILKSGGAFVPIDPDYPYERLSFMVEDSQAAVLLSHERLRDRLPSFWGHTIYLDSDWDTIAKKSEERASEQTAGDTLAYVMYTSGSTGKPKGVLVPHRGVCNSSEYYARIINLPPGSRMLQITSLGFDMSVFDIVPAIISGLTLCLADQAAPLGRNLLNVFKDGKIDLVSFPPTILSTVPYDDLPDLKFIGVAGEAVSTEQVALWSPGRRFYNAYGPAEGSVWCSGSFVDGTRRPHIGRAMDNSRIYLLDRHARLVPIGVPGELHIGGISVTRGYLGRPLVTADRYIPDPFSSNPGDRLYKTGDLARYLSDGNIEFVGRTDTQIKIRGIRIELGEIEAVLGTHSKIRENIVLAREDTPGEKRLAAYLVLQDEERPTTTELHTFLGEKLPENMIPSSFIFMDELPLTHNGKVDRKQLPAPDSSRPLLDNDYQSPSTATEESLVEIWQEILGLDQVGINDNFFELGGHSLLAAQFISRVQESLGTDLPLPVLFDAPTIRELAEVIEQGESRMEVEV